MKINKIMIGLTMFIATLGHAQTTQIEPHVFRVESGVSFELSNFGTSSYLFSWTDSSGSVVNEEDPTLILTAGQTYTFSRITGGHPFVITDTSLPVTGSDGSYFRTTVSGAVIDAATLAPIADFTADPAPTTDLIDWALVASDIGDYFYTCRITGHLDMTGRIEIVAGDQAQPREVQIRSIDFDNGIIEFFNYGTIDQDMTGWRTCTHDFNQALQYSGASGFNGVIIEAGTSVYIHFDNDAPANVDRLDRSSLGGGFSTPLDQDAYGMQLFFPAANGTIVFGNSALIADHVQWNIDGQGVGNAEFRTGQAVSEGLWTASGEFVSTAANSSSLSLTDVGDGRLHGPSNYSVVDPCQADLNGDGALDFFDISFFLSNTVDFNGDTVFDFFDISTFLTAFGAGCP